MIFKWRFFHQTVGGIGEKAAADFLRREQYRIIETNFRSGHHEIDLIVSKDHFIVFVEVKTRTISADGPSAFGRPACAVTKTKQKNLIAAAKNYVRKGKEGFRFRFDVVEVYLNPDHSVKAIHHMENAFTA